MLFEVPALLMGKDGVDIRLHFSRGVIRNYDHRFQSSRIMH